ncbi:MAG: amidohydrolase [Deltaproteobacteria bacterium]|nr:amidohydrolase [Deltaproteobacteria bacterium]HCH65550.1 amidohydrolase [Deltaproteobacteria bacterium]
MTLITLALSGLLSAGSAEAADLAIVHATVLPVVGSTIEDGTVLVEDGRIVAVGSGLPVPEGTTTVVDATGQFLTPGLIDLHSHMGVYSWPGVNAHSDGNEMIHPITPHVRAEDAVRVADPAFSRARAGGVTSILVLPGSGNLMGGQAAPLKLRQSRTLAGMRFAAAPRAIKMACGENPKRVYKEDAFGPMTRMGNLAWMRTSFQAALDYRTAREESSEPVAEDAMMEALLDVLDGEIRVHVHCYRHDDIEGIIRVMEEFDIRVTAFHHALEAYKVRDLIAEHGAGIATWPDWWGFKLEAYDAIPENMQLVKEVGVRVALHSDSPDTVQRLYTEAAKVVGYGMSEQDALETITLDPAILLGVQDRVGTIEVGKDADLTVFSKHPFDVTTLVEQTWIEGRLVFDRSLEGTPDAHP